MSETPLINVPLSSNVCPICVTASDQPPMTYQEWSESEWGLPGSDARYCGQACHCILMPEEMLAEFPAIDDTVKLRGEEGSEVESVVEISPAEEGLKEAMDTWNKEFGKLPSEIYDMNVSEIEPYLRKLMKKRVKR
ncbi:MAG: hypothetical protein ACYDH3_00310 [Candidatus Aminicenantales bacterium]